MKKERFDFKAAFERESEIKARLGEIADAMETENREKTDAEKAEVKELMREFDILEMKINANKVTAQMRSLDEAEDINAQMRETLKQGRRFELVIERDAETTANMFTQSTTPATSVKLTTNGIVKALYPRTIMSLLGIPFRTGLEGDYQWPVIETVEATLVGEGVALGDSNIPIGLLRAQPKRIGITVPVTSQAINKSAGLIQSVILESIPEAITQLMNKICFSPTAVSNSIQISGPFVSPKSGHAKTYVNGGTPTYMDLMNLAGIVAGENVIFDGTEAYVMNAAMFYTLKATPRADGQLGWIIDDNNRIGGMPVFVCPWIGAGNVGFGVWKYNPAALFGNFRLVVDPYSEATKDQVRFTLNVDFDTTVLRKEAFALLSEAAAAAAGGEGGEG